MGEQSFRGSRASDAQATHGRGATRWTSVALMPALVMLAMLPGACQSHEPLGRIVIPGGAKPTDPPLNPRPRHIVRLHGRAPESLDFRFRVSFLSTVREGDCWNHADFWEGGGERAFGYDIYPVRRGEHWEADFVVDRHLPGRCGWDIDAGVTVFVKPADVGWTTPGLLGGMRGVIGDARSWDETAPQCRPGMNACDEARRARVQNSDEQISVQIHCSWRVGMRAVGNDFFVCNEFADYKTLHYVKADTRRIRIDLYNHGTTVPPRIGVEESP